MKTNFLKIFKVYNGGLLGIILVVVITILSCTKVKQSEPEILLVGVFHKIPDSLKCNWENTYEKILDYKPDHIAVEYNQPQDSSSHIFTLGRNWKVKLDSLKLLWDGQKSSSLDSIIKYSKISQVEADIETHIKLWKYYYLNADRGNMHYQSYLIHKKTDTHIKSLDTLKKFDSLFHKRHKAITTQRKQSEFFNLIFPLAYNLGISYVEPTDNKSTYALQGEAYGKFSKELKDTPVWERWDSFWKDFSAEEDTKLLECIALEYVNSEAFLKITDYGQAHIFDDLNNKHYKEYSDVWYKRNGLIGDNIISLIETKNAKKVVVFYGYMHVYPVKKYLEEKGYKVKLLADLN